LGRNSLAVERAGRRACRRAGRRASRRELSYQRLDFRARLLLLLLLRCKARRYAVERPA
jgi:hypothetical protein